MVLLEELAVMRVRPWHQKWASLLVMLEVLVVLVVLVLVLLVLLRQLTMWKSMVMV